MLKNSEKYAEALFKAAEDLGCIETAADELAGISELIGQFEEYFHNPLISVREKTAALRETLSGQFSPLVSEFVIIMINRDHLKYLPYATEIFRRKRDDYYQRITVSIRIPYKPSEELMQRLTKRFENEGLIPKNAERITIDITEDKKIIGGFIAYCNGRQIDASLKTMLAKISRAERYGTQL